MSMKYIRDTYHVPAKRGMRVMANGRPGKIVSAGGAYLKIKLDDQKRPGLHHPTWNMIYYTDEGPKEFDYIR